MKKSGEGNKPMAKAPLGSVASCKRTRAQKNTSGDNCSNKPHEDLGLTFPWGHLSPLEIRQSGRAQAYLRWFQNQQELRPDKYLGYLSRLLRNSRIDTSGLTAIPY